MPPQHLRPTVPAYLHSNNDYTAFYVRPKRASHLFYIRYSSYPIFCAQVGRLSNLLCLTWVRNLL